MFFITDFISSIVPSRLSSKGVYPSRYLLKNNGVLSANGNWVCPAREIYGSLKATAKKLASRKTQGRKHSFYELLANNQSQFEKEFESLLKHKYNVVIAKSRAIKLDGGFEYNELYAVATNQFRREETRCERVSSVSRNKVLLIPTEYIKYIPILRKKFKDETITLEEIKSFFINIDFAPKSVYPLLRGLDIQYLYAFSPNGGINNFAFCPYTKFLTILQPIPYTFIELFNDFTRKSLFIFEGFIDALYHEFSLEKLDTDSNFETID